MDNLKIFVFGQRNIAYNQKPAVLLEFQKILNKIKSEKKNVFVYSGLQEGSELDLAFFSLKQSVSVVAAIPFRGFEQSFSEGNKVLYRTVASSVKPTIISPKYNPKAYGTRIDYLIFQCNTAVGVWNEREGHTKILLNSLLRVWKNKGYSIYTINQITGKSNLIKT